MSRQKILEEYRKKTILKPLRLREWVNLASLKNVQDALRERDNYYVGKAKENKKLRNKEQADFFKEKSKLTRENILKLEGKIRESTSKCEALDYEMCFLRGRIFILMDYVYQSMCDYKDFVMKHAESPNLEQIEEIKSLAMSAAQFSFEYGAIGGTVTEAYSDVCDTLIDVGNQLMIECYREMLRRRGGGVPKFVLDKYLPEAVVQDEE